jgi:hypothetical protein
MTLRTTQKDEIFRLIQAVSLDPLDFGWTEEDTFSAHGGNVVISVLHHRPSGGYAKFDYYGGDYMSPAKPYLLEISPGPNLNTETRDCQSWQGQLVLVKLWLLKVKEETEAPDLWGALQKSRELLATAAPKDNTPLSSAEVKLLSEQLEGFRHELLDKMAEHADAINRRFDCMEQAVEEAVERQLQRSTVLDIIIGELLRLSVEAALVHPIGWLLNAIGPLLPALGSGKIIG